MIGILIFIGVVAMVVTFIMGISNFRKVKIEDLDTEITDEMKAYNKKGTRYLLISVILVLVNIILFIILNAGFLDKITG